MPRFGMGFTALLVLLLLGALIWFFGYAWDRETLRYRLTYAVETPRGLVSSSGVIQTSREDTTRLPLPNTGYGYAVKGEAVVAEIAPGQFMFALLKESSPGKGAAQELPFQAFKQSLPRQFGESPVEYLRRLNAQKPRTNLPPGISPLLVTFTDIDDPKTVKRVDPGNLAAIFGAGYRLKSVTLEITGEPVTKGRIEEVLGWLETHKGRIKPPSLRLGPGLHPADSVLPEEKLTKLDFSKGTD